MPTWCWQVIRNTELMPPQICYKLTSEWSSPSQMNLKGRRFKLGPFHTSGTPLRTNNPFKFLLFYSSDRSSNAGTRHTWQCIMLIESYWLSSAGLWMGSRGCRTRAPPRGLHMVGGGDVGRQPPCMCVTPLPIDCRCVLTIALVMAEGLNDHGATMSSNFFPSTISADWTPWATPN